MSTRIGNVSSQHASHAELVSKSKEKNSRATSKAGSKEKQKPQCDEKKDSHDAKKSHAASHDNAHDALTTRSEKQAENVHPEHKPHLEVAKPECSEKNHSREKKDSAQNSRLGINAESPNATAPAPKEDAVVEAKSASKAKSAQSPACSAKN